MTYGGYYGNFSFERGRMLTEEEQASCTCIQDESGQWPLCPIHGQMQALEGRNAKYPGCISWKTLDDDRVAVLYPTVFGSRILVGPPNDMGGDEEFMFDSLRAGIAIFPTWDGYGPPDGWIRWSCKGKIYRKGEDGKPFLSE